PSELNARAGGLVSKAAVVGRRGRDTFPGTVLLPTDRTSSPVAMSHTLTDPALVPRARRGPAGPDAPPTGTGVSGPPRSRGTPDLIPQRADLALRSHLPHLDDVGTGPDKGDPAAVGAERQQTAPVVGQMNGEQVGMAAPFEEVPFPAAELARAVVQDSIRHA